MMNCLVTLGFFFSILTVLIPPIDIRVGTEASDSPTASISGAAGEVYRNKPCHHVAYLYDWVGRLDKTAKIVSDIIRTEYRNTPGGLSGNDDCGQMSVWYVFSCMGFYPVCPGSAEYALGSPAFATVTIHQKNGSDFTIVRNADRSGTSFRLNGKRHPSPFLKHSDLVEGALLFE